MMQLGIHVGTFSRPTFDEILDAVLEHGLECVHFNFKALGMPSMPERVDEDTCRQAAEAVARRGLQMGTVSGTFNMIHPDPAERRNGLERFEVIARSAELLGTKVVTLCTGTRDPHNMWQRDADNDTPEAWADLTATLEKALMLAEQYDVTLGVEPEVSNVVDTAAKARRLLDEMGSPRLKIIMDGANLFHGGELARMDEVLERAFELLGPDIVLAHAKDLDRDGEAGQIAAGKGLLNYDCYLGLLKKVGFEGPLIMHSLAETEVAGSVRFLREKLARL
ncbi:MAG: sugar phosphate isomerase/epimerase [Pirellulales bacterium]|nr:sugar phosphate isomerase/epimerase [Pirellulales bacterium]